MGWVVGLILVSGYLNGVNCLSFGFFCDVWIIVDYVGIVTM